MSKAQTFFIFSTLASDVAYTNHREGGSDLPIALPPVVVKGGAGVANERIVTPRGVATRVTAEEVEYLRQNEIFKLHEKNGFVMVSEDYVDPDIAAADMTGRDNSAPIVSQDGLMADAVTVVGGEETDAAPVAPKRARK